MKVRQDAKEEAIFEGERPGSLRAGVASNRESRLTKKEIHTEQKFISTPTLMSLKRYSFLAF